jgi:hypothetical protein
MPNPISHADLTERAREYLDDWFGLDQWPPVHRFVELLTGFAQSEREADAAEARRTAIEECAQWLETPQQRGSSWDAAVKELSGYPGDAWFLTADREVVPVLRGAAKYIRALAASAPQEETQ